MADGRLPSVRPASEKEDVPIYEETWRALYSPPPAPPAARRARVSAKAKAHGADGR